MTDRDTTSATIAPTLTFPRQAPFVLAVAGNTRTGAAADDDIRDDLRETVEDDIGSTHQSYDRPAALHTSPISEMQAVPREPAPHRVADGPCPGALAIEGKWLLVTLRTLIGGHRRRRTGRGFAWRQAHKEEKGRRCQRRTRAPAERRCSAARRRFTTTESRTLP
jgi:hypothetical protein